MSFGKLGKFIFEFAEAFWSDLDTDRYVAISKPTITSPSISDLLKSGKKVSVSELRVEPSHSDLPQPWDFPVLILNMDKISNVPSLLCFTQGQLTENLEANSDKAWEYMKPIISKLNSNLTGSEIPEPINVIATQWTQDPFSRGSYAACKPGDDPTALVIALERGLDNVRFAGEHTILDGAGAAHGAWLSGAREAESVLIKLGIKEGELGEW